MSFFRGTVALLLLLLLSTGCTKSAGARTSSERVFRVASGSEPGSMDPTLATGVPFHRIHLALFSTLVVNDPETGEPRPGQAERWEVSADGKTYIFVLREGLKWSDGVALTAQDFVYSWKRILNPEVASNYAWFPASVVEGGQDYLDGKGPADGVAVRALDERRFQVSFVAALPYLLEMLSHYSFAAVPQHVVEKYGADWTKPENYVSSGPYKMALWQIRERLELVPNPYYHDQAQIGFDRVIFLPVEDGNTAYNMFMNGEVDWLTAIPTDHVDTVRDDPRTFISPYLASTFYNFNVNRPFLKDVRVRQAISLAIDRRALTSEVLRTGVIPSFSLVPPMAGYPELSPYRPEEFSANVAKAKELLAEAGFPGGQGLPTLTLYYNTNESNKKVCEFLQEQWRTHLGINVEIFNMEWKTFLSLRRSSDFDIARNGWVGDYRDPSTFIDLFASGSGLNDSDYASPLFDEFLQQARVATDPVERMKLLAQAEARLLQDQAVIPLFFSVSTNMIDTRKWEGWYTNIQDVHPFTAIRPKS